MIPFGDLMPGSRCASLVKRSTGAMEVTPRMFCRQILDVSPKP